MNNTPLPFSVWAIADLHLSFGTKNKSMDIFGDVWSGWTDKIARNWNELIKETDLVLIPGDISWAMNVDQALADLAWIDSLPGTKVLIRGNHDYWWSSKTKVEKALPPSLHIIQNNAFHYKGVAVGGVRLWDTREYNFNQWIVLKENAQENPLTTSLQDAERDEKIFERELQRLELSLGEMDKNATHRIAMTHYPPIGAGLAETRASQILSKHHVEICVFGHLHSLIPKSLPFGVKNGVRYALTSCDYLDFIPLKIL